MVRDRFTLLDAVATALIGVLLSWLFLSWDVVPPLLWSVPVALTTFGLTAGAVAWPGLPWVAPGRRTWVAATSTAVGVALSGAVVWLVFA